MAGGTEVACRRGNGNEARSCGDRGLGCGSAVVTAYQDIGCGFGRIWLDVFDVEVI